MKYYNRIDNEKWAMAFIVELVLVNILAFLLLCWILGE